MAEEPVITEESLATYTNLETELPDVGERIEVLSFFLRPPRAGHPRYPVHTYSVYTGTVLTRNATNITFSEARAKYVEDRILIQNGPAIPDMAGQLRLPIDNTNYWRYDTDLLTTALPEAQTFKPVGSTSPQQVKQPVTMSPLSVMSPFGGKTRKSRKNRKSRKSRKSRRK
jgi:hypothetical protein